MKRRIALIGVLALCVGLLASCLSPKSGLRVESYPHSIITVNSKIVGGYLTVTEVNATMRNNLLQAQVRVQNESQKDLQIEYKFRWLDSKGMEVDTRTATWTPMNINAKGIVFMQGMAPTRDTADFVLDVRFRQTALRWK